MAKEQNFEHPPGGHVAILIYDPTNDRFQVVQGDDVDTAIPAAGKSLLASALAHGYDGSAWRKLPLLWGYSDVLISYQGTTTATVGRNTFTHPGPAAGEIWKNTRVLCVNVNTDPSQIRWSLVPSVGAYRFHTKNEPGVDVYDEETVEIYATADYDITCAVDDCALNDDVYTYMFGYKMNIAQ